MPYPALDPGKYGPGMPLDVSNLEALYRGGNKTNGFLMRNSDGRIPALQLPVGRFLIDAANVLYDDDFIPWGNGVWTDIAGIATRPGGMHAEKPSKGLFAGVLKLNQGWLAGNPVQPNGLPSYSKGTVVARGLVGYKTVMAAVGKEDEYLAYLKGARDQDVAGTRTTWKEWTAAYAAAGDGSRLGLFFGDDSGFPVVSVVAKADVASPVLTGATFAGFAAVFEKEHEAVIFDIGGGA
jgi:hypothetical protein